jgi:hypothetical protein
MDIFDYDNLYHMEERRLHEFWDYINSVPHSFAFCFGEDCIGKPNTMWWRRLNWPWDEYMVRSYEEILTKNSAETQAQNQHQLPPKWVKPSLDESNKVSH